MNLASLLVHSIAVAVPALFLVAEAKAYNYSLVANAGGDDSATSDVEVSAVMAQDRNPVETGGAAFEVYTASADALGSLSASADGAGVPPFAPIAHRAAARIEETIRLLPPPFPTGDVTVTVGVSAGLTASG